MQSDEGFPVFPFGKHKGKPLHEVAQDTKYVDWLRQQPWFRDKFGDIFDNVPEDNVPTPEHNALQLKFLDPLFADKFRNHLYQLIYDKPYPSTCPDELYVAGLIKRVKDHIDGWGPQTVHFSKLTYSYWHEWDEVVEACNAGVTMSDDDSAIAVSFTVGCVEGRVCAQLRPPPAPRVVMEPFAGSDVLLVLPPYVMVDVDIQVDERGVAFQTFCKQHGDEFHCEWKGLATRVAKHVAEVLPRSICEARFDSPFVFVEVKPALGDDYPAVLRQIDGHRRRLSRAMQGIPEIGCHDVEQLRRGAMFVLLVGSFFSEVCGREQLQQFFRTSRVHVIFLDQL